MRLRPKQVAAVARALKRRGFELPRDGYCVVVGKVPRLRRSDTPAAVCNLDGQYTFVGGFSVYENMARRRKKFGR